MPIADHEIGELLGGRDHAKGLASTDVVYGVPDPDVMVLS
jgi:hypothetical protein